MTEYERGFAKKCAEHGLSERQAGALYGMMKRAYIWDIDGQNSSLRQGQSTGAGVIQADNKFLNENPGVNVNDYTDYVSRNTNGFWSGLGRLWNHAIHSREWNRNHYADQRRALQDKYLDSMDTDLDRSLDFAARNRSRQDKKDAIKRLNDPNAYKVAPSTAGNPGTSSPPPPPPPPPSHSMPSQYGYRGSQFYL